MKYQAILNLKFGIYPVDQNRCLPMQQSFGKSLKIITGSTKEECEINVKDFLKANGFQITSEGKNND